MKQVLGIAFLFLVLYPRAGAQDSATETYAIDRPTIIAFFRPVTDAEMEKDPDTNEALGDFQLYASQVAPKLKKQGIHFEVASAITFQVKDGARVRKFRAGKIPVGYYFIAPGQVPHIRYGVMTDLDILEAAAKYFHMPADGP